MQTRVCFVSFHWPLVAARHRSLPMDKTKSSILSDSDFSAFSLMRMRKKRCKWFGAGFSVVRHDAVGGQGNFSAFSNAFLIILCRRMATS